MKLKLPKIFTKTWNEYYNPFYVWWKVHDLFKFPHIHFYHGNITWFFGMPITKNKYNKRFDFRMSAVGWKTKYNHVEHEWPPYIVITFFRKYQLLWVFNYVTKKDENSWASDIATWEAMLDIIYDDCPLDKVFNRHLMSNDISIKNNLTKKGYEIMCNKRSSWDSSGY